MQATALAWSKQDWSGSVGACALKIALRPLYVLILAPSLLFLATLTAMLFRHPDVRFYQIDRIAFGLLIVGVVGRAAVQRRPLFLLHRASWPMLALAGIALASVLRKPFDPEMWSLLASKFIVPFTLFHLAQVVFADEKHRRRFEIFSLVVLAYLSFTSIAFLAGARSLIFPRFILDESLGNHIDRARGPLLQAVANGVSLNILGVLALHTYQRGAARGAKMLVLLASVPVAILATMTRAVWLSFAGTVLVLIFLGKKKSVWRVCMGLGICAAAGLVFIVSSKECSRALCDRFGETGPVNYREAMYTGGWRMFLERPLAGWGFHTMPAALPHYVSGYQESVLYPHNTYLELLVEHGILGLVLYVWLMWEIWRLGRGPKGSNERQGFLDHEFYRLWPILLAIYWVNAAVVVMSYQFVNGLLFTLAGMLAGQQQRGRFLQSC